jgi:hypothetical protein
MVIYHQKKYEKCFFSSSIRHCFHFFFIFFSQRRSVSYPDGKLPPLDDASQAAIDNVVNIVFTQIDADGNGEITYEEFIDGYYKYPEICSFFKQL